MIFDAQLVHRQLLYSGVFEVVKIQQSGLPCRLTYREFTERFKCICPSSSRWKLKNPQEMIDIFKSKLFNFSLPNIQTGSTLVFFKGLEQRVLESRRDLVQRNGCVKIQQFQRCSSRRRLFAGLIQVVRVLLSHTSQLHTSLARVSLESIQGFVNHFEMLSGYSILTPMLTRQRELVELVNLQELLVAEAQALVDQKSESALQQMQQVMSRAKVLHMTKHAIIMVCDNLVSNYEVALKFIADSSNEEALSLLGFEDICVGIEKLSAFEGIIPAATDSLTRVIQWRDEVENEIEVVFKSLLVTFEQSVVRYDELCGVLVPFDTHAATRLKKQMSSLKPQVFKCMDTKDLFQDCTIFLRLYFTVLPSNDGALAVEIANTYLGHSETMTDQLSAFKKWGFIQTTVDKLKTALTKGGVPGSALGTEPKVEIRDITENVDILKKLQSASPQVVAIVTATTWILDVKRMSAYLFFC